MATFFAAAWLGSDPAWRITPRSLMMAQRQTPGRSCSVRAKLLVAESQTTSNVASEKRQCSENNKASASEGMVRKQRQMGTTWDMGEKE